MPEESKDPLGQITKEAVEEIGARGGGIYLFNPKQDYLSLISEYNRPHRFRWPLPKGMGVCGHLLTSIQEYRIVKNYREHEQRYQGFVDDYCSFIAVKFLTGSGFKGAIFAEHTDEGVFDKAHVQRLRESIVKITSIIDQEDDPFVLGKRSLLDQLVKNAPMGIISAEGRSVTSFNQRACDMFGYRPGEIIGQDLGGLYADDDVPIKIKESLRTQSIAQNERVQARKADGSVFPLRITVTNLGRSPKGKRLTVGYMEDLSDLNREELRSDFLLGCMTKLAEADSLTHGLGSLADHITQYLGARCFVYLRDSHTDYYALYASDGTQEPAVDRNTQTTVKREWFEGNIPDEGLSLTVQEEMFGEISIHLGLDAESKAMMIHPLVHQNQRFGFLCLAESRVQGFLALHQTTQLLKAVAKHVSSFVYREHLHEEQSRTRKQMDALFESGKTLVSNRNPSEILEMLAGQIREATDAWWVSMFEVNRSSEVKGIVKQGRSIGKSKLGKQDWPEEWLPTRSTGLTRWVIEKGELIVISDVNNTDYTVNPKVVKRGVKSVLGLPMMFKDRCIGVVWIHFDRVRYFSQQELELLQVYAGQATIAYDASRDLAQQKAVLAAITSLDQETDFDKVQQSVIDHLASVLSFSVVALRLYDQKHHFLSHAKTVSNSMGKDNIKLTDFDKLPKGLLGFDDGEKVYFFTQLKGRVILSIRINPELFAIILIHRNKGARFDERERGHLGTLARHAALALARTHVHRRLDIGMAMTRSVARAARSGNVFESSRQIVDDLSAHLNAAIVGMVIYSPDRDHLYPTVFKGNQKTLGELAENLSSRDFIKQIHYLGPLWREKEGFAIVPLDFEDTPLGLLALGFDREYRFDKEEREIIQMVARLVSGYVKNALLLTQNRDQQEVLRGLRESGRESIDNLDMESSLKRLARVGARLTLPKTETPCIVEFWRIQGNQCSLITINEHHARVSENVVEIEFAPKPPRGLVHECANTQKSIYASSIDEHPEYVSIRPQTRSQLAIPLVAGKKTIGVLSAEHPEKNAFDTATIGHFEALAVQASIIMQCVLLHQDTKALGGFIGNQTAINWIAMVSATWGHNIKREVGTARATLALLEDDIQNGVTDDIQDHIGNLEETMGKIAKMPLLAPLTHEDKTAVVDIFELVEKYFQDFWFKGRAVGIELKLDLRRSAATDKVKIFGSPNWLRRLFEIIAENAVRAMRESEATGHSFKVTAELTEEWVVIRMRDTGPGIPEQLRGKLLHEPVRYEEGAKGAGIGMVLASTIAQAYNGYLKLDDTYEGGAEFVLSLPIMLQDEIQPNSESEKELVNG